MSWFATGLNSLSTLKSAVQSNLPLDPSLLQKITLQSPELAAERSRIDEEERRKESVRDALSEILPWETRDAEMEILVDECKDVILGLSSSVETFTGPFVLSGGLEKDDDEEEVDDDLKAARDIQEAEKSSEKLSKLQPLPPLLANFDLDTHVGLIQRLFKADPKLVQMHSRLSSGGKRELAFWKNYFFHCAYARYEAGLSIDEIWSESRPEEKKVEGGGESKEEDGFNIVAHAEEDEIVFDEGEGSEIVPEVKQYNSAPVQSKPLVVKETEAPKIPKQDPLDTSNISADSTGGTDYEFVVDGGDDGEIDELDAEIAAALED